MSFVLKGSWVGVALLIAASLGGCDDAVSPAADGASKDTSSQDVPVDAAGELPVPDAVADGGTPDVGQETSGAPQADTYWVGLEKAGAEGNFTIRLMKSSPIPQDLTLYTWEIEVLDGAGEPVTGASVEAEPRMPAHGHGTFPPVTPATALDQAGRYQLLEMDLFMAGIWRVEIRVTHGELTDSVNYFFDLEG